MPIINPSGGSITIGTTVFTSGTTGSVLFIGAGAVVQQDNAAFFWDDTNNRLGIGNAATVAAGTVASAGDFLIVGSQSSGGTNRSAIRFTGAGFDSTPSSANANANGDKLVMYNDVGGKVSIGCGSNFDMWFQCNGNPNSDFVWWGGTAAAPVVRMRLAAGGLLTLSNTTLLATSVALTNGAAAAVGTLGNAPTAGNPTKWIPISDNGTTRYIPAW